MSELDEKLYEIWFESHGNSMPDDNIKVVEKIKQAFKEAGWMPITQELIRLTMTPTPKYKVVNEDELRKVMTGQEWYERFQNELSGYLKTSDVVGVRWTVQAAKRAAGIGE